MQSPLSCNPRLPIPDSYIIILVVFILIDVIVSNSDYNLLRTGFICPSLLKVIKKQKQLLSSKHGEASASSLNLTESKWNITSQR